MPKKLPSHLQASLYFSGAGKSCSVLAASLSDHSKYIGTSSVRCQSSETTLLKVVNDLLLTLDSGNNAVMNLLDLCVAFDTQNHDTLLAHLDWARRTHHTGSVLISRTFSFCIGEFSSSSALVSYGVHLGSSALQPVYAPTR